MREKGKAMMGRGEASGEKRVLNAAVAAISNPLIENPSIKRASGLIISITGGKDLSLFEVDEAATRIREEADPDANIIIGASFDECLEGIVRVSVVATGIDNPDPTCQTQPAESLLTELAGRLSNVSRHVAGRIKGNAPCRN
jgi:cell division protein FtsZ